MSKVINRVGKLTRAIRQIGHSHFLEDLVNQTLEDSFTDPASIVVFSDLVAQAPKGDRWTEESFEYRGRVIFHGRPSVRINKTTLEGGWLDPEPWSELMESGFSIRNRALHIRTILEGYEGYHIYPLKAKGRLAWNRPWEEGRSEGVTLREDVVTKQRPANRFSDRVAEQNRGLLTEFFHSAARHVIATDLSFYLFYEMAD